jgi:glycosyltransferase involved in cell wall biosynthesis
MKLAIVSSYPPEISGVGQYGARFSQGFARMIDRVAVFANRVKGAPAEEKLDGVTVFRVWDRDRIAASPSILRTLHQWQPDAVWFNIGLSMFGRSRPHNFFALTAPMLSRASGLPTVVTLHEIFEAANLRALGTANGHLTHWGGHVATRMILQADRVCVTLHAYQRIIERHYGKDNIVHIPHGTYDRPHFSAPPGQKRILIFATYAPYKGLPDLIEIFKSLRDADSAVQLTIAGSDHPRFPGYLADVRSRYKDVDGIEWRVGIPEHDLPSLFNSARVVALPYTATTGASSVAHRAAAQGRPMVAYDLPDLRTSAAEDRVHIEFVPLGDKESFAKRLRDLLNDPIQCEMIGRANVTAMQAMTLEMMCHRYIQIFEQAIKRSSRVVTINPLLD